MLLYTRLAPPKIPKRRSRAGCCYCKEKKKKCDEERPQCSRCAERGLDCTYEEVKPRQRRKRDGLVSDGIPRQHAHSPPQSPGRRLSESSHVVNTFSLRGWAGTRDHQLLGDDVDDSDLVSPLDTSFDTTSLIAFPTPDMTELSPVDFVSCDFPLRLGEAETEEAASSKEICRIPASTGVRGSAVRSLHPDLAMIAPYPVRSPLAEFVGPAYLEFSDRPNRRALVDHFCSVLSHLIVFREESGNPFQQLVLPLTKRSSAVTNAIYALASAHLEYRGVKNNEKSLYFHNQAIQGLARMIERERGVNSNELLATIMLLVYYEVLVQKGRSNIVDGHLKGALTIMVSNPDASEPTAMFLERAFRFYDVIAALSFGTAPLSTAPAAGCLLPFPPLGAAAASPLRNVDTLLGMATTLWPIIHRLSNLLPLKTELDKAVRSNEMASKVTVLRTEFETTAEAIAVALEQWKPALPPNCSLDDKDNTKVIVEGSGDGDDGSAARARIHSILNNALAYRHSAFVYLFRTIYGHDRTHPLVQSHAHLSLTHCVATVSHAGPMGALLWPLFVAACEAVAADDRELTRRAFAAIDKRQGMMNIERSWDIVREVWRRADATREDDAGPSFPSCLGGGGKGADLWRRVTQDMGVSVVFG